MNVKSFITLAPGVTKQVFGAVAFAKFSALVKTRLPAVGHIRLCGQFYENF
jgi:hypothetical protein